MNRRRIAMISALAVMTVLLCLVVWQRSSQSADEPTRQIRIAGGGDVDGLLLKLVEGSYIVQTAEECLIVESDQIETVDGQRGWMLQPPVSKRVVRTQKTFEVITPDGDIELHSRIEKKNSGSKILSRVRWGIAKHEIPQLEQYEIVDEFGNHLAYQVEDDPSIDGKRIEVELARPVLPGETMRLTTVLLQKDAIRREGDLWIYRNRGDYPDDRLVTRSVRLPAGAEIVSADPEPLQILETGNGPVVVWRRYFVRGEILPWEIRFRL